MHGDKLMPLGYPVGIINLSSVTSLTAEAASFFSRRVGVKGQSGP